MMTGPGALVLLACILPTLLGYSLSPASTLFNQLLALSLWGLVLCSARGPAARPAPAQWAVLAALAVMLPGIDTQALALLAAAAALLLAPRDLPQRLGLALALGLWAAGLVSTLIAFVQVYLPQWADGLWLARSGLPGRAVGNLRQPNHLATLLLWAMVAAVWLGVALPHWRRACLASLLPLCAALVLSASRTGLLVGLPLLMLWGLLDRSLPRSLRVALALLPLLAWGLAAGLEGLLLGLREGSHLGVQTRLDAEGAGSPSRLAILANAWTLLQQHPWSGVGWGEFNRAWTLTPFPGRPTAFFDHCHNLPLQLLVELGWPRGLLVLGLLGWAFWVACRRAWQATGASAIERRAPLMVLLMVAAHSMLEYPLWYAYFLLPTALAWGLCLAEDEPVAAPAWTAKLLPGLGLLLILGSALALWDYRAVVAIYAPAEDGSSLRQRVEAGQRSLFFAPMADYAAATAMGHDAAALQAASRSGHQLIDVRLLMAWARSLHATGETDKARYLVERLREFRSPEGEAWLAECEEGADAWFCTPPARRYSWKEF